MSPTPHSTSAAIRLRYVDACFHAFDVSKCSALFAVTSLAGNGPNETVLNQQQRTCRTSQQGVCFHETCGAAAELRQAVHRRQAPSVIDCMHELHSVQRKHAGDVDNVLS